MIALLAICRKLIILDLGETDALHVLAFAAVILALVWFIGWSAIAISALLKGPQDTEQLHRLLT